MNQSLKGKRIAVLIANNYEDLELWYPTLRLRAAGAEVQLVGEKAGEAYTAAMAIRPSRTLQPATCAPTNSTAWSSRAGLRQTACAAIRPWSDSSGT